jgi:hypothetical protein
MGVARNNGGSSAVPVGKQQSVAVCLMLSAFQVKNYLHTLEGSTVGSSDALER